MSVNLRKRSRRWGTGPARRIGRIIKVAGFLALTYMAIDSACTRQGPAIAVAAPLIGYLALVAYLVRHRRDRPAKRR